MSMQVIANLRIRSSGSQFFQFEFYFKHIIVSQISTVTCGVYCWETSNIYI